MNLNCNSGYTQKESNKDYIPFKMSKIYSKNNKLLLVQFEHSIYYEGYTFVYFILILYQISLISLKLFVSQNRIYSWTAYDELSSRQKCMNQQLLTPHVFHEESTHTWPPIQLSTKPPLKRKISWTRNNSSVHFEGTVKNYQLMDCNKNFAPLDEETFTDCIVHLAHSVFHSVTHILLSSTSKEKL